MKAESPAREDRDPLRDITHFRMKISIARPKQRCGARFVCRIVIKPAATDRNARKPPILTSGSPVNAGQHQATRLRPGNTRQRG
jgi:hypothetical protein